MENDNKDLEPPPKPRLGKFSDLNRFKRRLCAIVGTHSPCEYSRFLDFYSGRRRRIYQDAVTSLASRVVERRDANLKTFVKAEKINISKKPDPAPRVIQPRTPRYNVEVGRFLRPLEHHIYHGVDKIWGGPTIMKGYTVEKLGEIIHEHWR